MSGVPFIQGWQGQDKTAEEIMKVLIDTRNELHADFARRAIEGIANETGLLLSEAPNHFAAQAAIDACVQAGGALKAVAVGLIKIANDIRWLGSGPRCGLGELRLPAT